MEGVIYNPKETEIFLSNLDGSSQITLGRSVSRFEVSSGLNFYRESNNFGYVAGEVQKYLWSFRKIGENFLLLFLKKKSIFPKVNNEPNVSIRQCKNLLL